MEMRKTILGLATFACALVASACIPDRTVTPDEKLSASGEHSAVKGKEATYALGVSRLVPLTKQMTASMVIGAGGGSLSIPEAGVTITVPAGALASNTEISITARKGALIAYDFKPHGLTFATPLMFTQQLSGTNATLANISLFQLGYYEDPIALNATGGTMSEMINGSVNAVTWVFTSTIPHFSGYMMSCGRETRTMSTVDGM